MRKWKSYVGLRDKKLYNPFHYSLSLKPSELTKGKHYPGIISNEDILEDKKNYYTTDDPSDIYNIILKPDLREVADYKILNAQQWNFLYEKYKGVMIKRERS